jgi:hypothetical protein
MQVAVADPGLLTLLLHHSTQSHTPDFFTVVIELSCHVLIGAT